MPEETPHRTRRCSWLQPVLTLAAALMARTFLTRAETCQDVVQSNARLGPMQRALVFAGLFTTCVFTGQSIARVCREVVRTRKNRGIRTSLGLKISLCFLHG